PGSSDGRGLRCNRSAAAAGKGDCATRQRPANLFIALRLACQIHKRRPMTQSAEDSARAILWIFSLEDVRAGHALMYQAVNLQFLKSRSAEDFAAGLAFAIERKWLSNENIMIRLTKSGFDETQKLK